jgi:riboflavin biosynthesis pyrimidine reductase
LAALTDEHLRIVLTRYPDRFRSYAREGQLEFKGGDLGEICGELQARGRKRCAVLGGTGVYTACIRRGLMQELWVTLEPLGFGSGKRIFEGQVAFQFHLQSVEYLSEDTLLLKYQVL